MGMKTRDAVPVIVDANPRRDHLRFAVDEHAKVRMHVVTEPLHRVDGPPAVAARSTVSSATGHRASAHASLKNWSGAENTLPSEVRYVPSACRTASASSWGRPEAVDGDACVGAVEAVVLVPHAIETSATTSPAPIARPRAENPHAFLPSTVILTGATALGGRRAVGREGSGPGLL